MPIVLDTSLLVAFANREDPDHERASELMHRILKGEHGTPVSTDDVLDEGLTVLQARTGRREDALVFASYFVPVEQADGSPILEYLHTPSSIVEAARSLFFDRFERGLSFTDCVLAALAKDLAGQVASLEEDFEGIVPTVTH